LENLSAWKIVKTGFLLGIGFMIPLLLMNVAVLGVSISSIYSSLANFDDFENLEEFQQEYPGFADHIADISIEDYHFLMQGNQLLIHGIIKNNGTDVINSIELEAELFDESEQYVYECSEYMSSKLMPEQQENFQITCGCSDNGLPEFQSVKVKVTNASSY